MLWTQLYLYFDHSVENVMSFLFQQSQQLQQALLTA